MNTRHVAGTAAVAIGIALATAHMLSQSQPSTEGPAVDGSPGWFLQGSFPDPGGRTVVDAAGRVTIPPRQTGTGPAAVPPSPIAPTPPCTRSPLCGKRRGIQRTDLQRVQWKPTLGYTFT